MIVYADVLFLINFIMDMLCLFICAKVLNLKIMRMRFTASSVLGALYGVLSAIVDLWEPLCGIAVSAVMILICFDFKRIFVFIKTILLMYCVGMLFGGIMTFLSRIIYENRNLKLFSDGVDIKLFVLLFGITLLFVLPTAKLFGTYFHRKSVVCTLYTDTASKTVRLLMDTGNILKDPYTDKPVVIIKKDILDDLLGKNGVHRCYNECNDKMALESRLRFINAKTVSGCVLLPVIGAVKISAYKADGKPRELFAVVAADVSDENDYDGNDGVIPYMLESSF